MGIFDNCLIASDIDGTLLTNNYINPKNLEKIEFFMSEGGCFSLSTGRSVGAINPVLRKLKKISPCIVANGCMIYDYQKRCLLYEDTIPECDYHLARQICDCGLNVGCEIHCGEFVYTLSRTSEIDDHQTYEGLTSDDVDFNTVCKYNWNKTIFTFDSFEEREEIKNMISRTSHNSTFVETAAEIGGRLRPYFEQLPKGVSKASALLKLAEILNIKKGNIFAIGDYYNDLEMLKAADISAVPSESPDDIKLIADYITVSCNDGAVADFIDYLTKIKQNTI